MRRGYFHAWWVIPPFLVIINPSKTHAQGTITKGIVNYLGLDI